MIGPGRSKRAAAVVGLVLAAVVTLPAMASADEWTSGSDFIDATIEVGWDAELTHHAGSVSTHSQFVMVSGQFKIANSIVAVVAQPGYTYVVKKAGGLDSAIEVAFTNGPCEALYRFLIKPGLTKVDGGVLRCR